MLQNTINSITVGLHGSSTTAYLPHSIVPAPVARSKLTLVPCLNCRRQTPSSPRTAGANGAPSGRSYLKLQNNRRFSIENRRFPGTIVHNLCIFNRKFQKSWHLCCNLLENSRKSWHLCCNLLPTHNHKQSLTQNYPWESRCGGIACAVTARNEPFIDLFHRCF